MKIRVLMIFALLRAQVSADVNAELCAIICGVFACCLLKFECIHGDEDELIVDTLVV